jgi:hypothetical protein
MSGGGGFPFGMGMAWRMAWQAAAWLPRPAAAGPCHGLLSWIVTCSMPGRQGLGLARRGQGPVRLPDRSAVADRAVRLPPPAGSVAAGPGLAGWPRPGRHRAACLALTALALHVLPTLEALGAALSGYIWIYVGAYMDMQVVVDGNLCISG